MRALGITSALAVALSLPVLAAGHAAAAVVYKGTVADVVDGDSIMIALQGERAAREVRLIGVDVPQGCGDLAEQFVEARLDEGDVVRVRIDKKHEESDHRLFGYVYEGGTSVNLELVRRGAARVRTYGTFGVEQQFSSRFLEAQQAARESDRGLWDDGEFVCD